MAKLPWEILTPFSDFVRALPSKQLREEEDDEDEDEMQAHQDSMQRLRVSRLRVRCNEDQLTGSPGRRRSDETDDKGRIRALLGLQTSLVHLP